MQERRVNVLISVARLAYIKTRNKPLYQRSTTQNPKAVIPELPCEGMVEGMVRQTRCSRCYLQRVPAANIVSESALRPGLRLDQRSQHCSPRGWAVLQRSMRRC